ncbi:MAG: hypothetical protein F6K11_24510 [Leptolyngbya sp. SIO3F4]|nr:hypothetical protein [Leptolyngbya sp. SIO3F4]
MGQRYPQGYFLRKSGLADYTMLKSYGLLKVYPFHSFYSWSIDVRKKPAMLDRLVRPLVRTQIQLLAQNPSANSRLTGMVSQWLGYLGVKADVTQLNTEEGKIQISLAVCKPDQCSENEWCQILANIEQNKNPSSNGTELTYGEMSSAQKSKVHRLLASVIRAGERMQYNRGIVCSHG